MNRQQAFFVAVTVVGAGVGVLMLAPFVPHLLAAVLLAFVYVYRETHPDLDPAAT